MEQRMRSGSLPVVLLAALGFVLGTCEFVIVGILPEIARGLDTSLAAVGRLVSVFAACYALGTPLLTAATGRFPRRLLLGSLLAVFLGTNVVSILAPNVVVLYVSRVLAALATGTLTAVAMLFAKEVAPRGQTARAISLVYGGFSVAAVAGVPLGTAICQTLGWRWTFAVIVLMGGALLPVLLRALPEVEGAPAEGGFFRQFTVLGDSRFTLCGAMVLCSAGATYIVYTYLTPILTDTLGLAEGAVSPILLVMGLCSGASNLLSGRLGERGGLERLRLPFALQALLLALLPLLLGRRWTGLAGLFAMGLLMYLLNTPVQVHALSLAEQDYPHAASLCASLQPVAYNFGIAIGSYVGSGVQEVWGFRSLGFPAAVPALAALGLNLVLLSAGRRGTPTGRGSRVNAD